jgi:hypothetical protein
MPNKEVLTLWVEDLETTDAKQGTGFLHTKDDDGTERFCCLGRLAKLAVDHGVIPPPIEGNSLFRYGAHAQGEEGFDSDLVLPWAVQQWAGIESDPELIGDGIDDQPMTASGLNDTWGYSFRRIAEVIREKYDL